MKGSRAAVLTHFCEQHGPAIVFTTQAIPSLSDLYSFPQSFLKTKNHLPKIFQELSSEKIHFYSPSSSEQDSSNPLVAPDTFSFDSADPTVVKKSTNTHISQNFDESNSPLLILKNEPGVQFQLGKTPSVSVTVYSSVNNGNQTDLPPSKSQSCLACSSLKDGTGLVSLDEDGKNYFISTHYPVPASYSIVRTACVRSLSCEFCPGREGPIIFSLSEKDKEWALSYMFKLKDSRARGEARWYSFLVLMDDPLLLVHSMVIMSKFFSKLVSEMQENSQILFDKETKENGRQQTYSVPVRNYGIFRRQGSNTLRPLTELMSDENFFARLHYRFSWILKHIGKDMVNLLINIPSSFLGPSYLIDLSICEIMEDLSYSEIYNTLGPDCMRGLIYNIIIGNQIIIRGSVQIKNFVVTLLKVIGRLLPEPCRKLLEYSETYRDSWQYNLLGLSAEVDIPDYVEPSSYAMIDIIRSSADTYTFEYLGKSTEKTFLGNEIEKFMEAQLPKHIEHMRLINIQQEWLSKVRTFYFVSQKVVSEKDPKLKQFLRVLNLSKNDIEVLKYWSASIKTSLKKLPK